MGRDVSFFFCGKQRLSVGKSKWWKRASVTQINARPIHRFACGNGHMCHASGSLITILLHLSIPPDMSPHFSLPGCSLNTTMVSFTLTGGWGTQPTGDFLGLVLLYLLPSWKYLIPLEPPSRGLWIFLLCLSKSGCHSFPRYSLGLLIFCF